MVLMVENYIRASPSINMLASKVPCPTSFNWLYVITSLIFLNAVICSEADSVFSTKNSFISVEQENSELTKELFDIEDFAEFNNSFKEVKLMIKELEGTENVEKSLNCKLLTISKFLMDYSSKISKSSSDRSVILECLTDSICLIDDFIPLYKKKKEMKDENIFFQLIENIMLKFKDLHLTLIRILKKQQLNLTKFNLIKSELKDLEEETKTLLNNYDIYLDLLNDNTVFYNDMESSLLDLKIRFEEFKKNVPSMEVNILKEESNLLEMAVCFLFRTLARCFMKDDEKFDCILNNLEKFVKRLKF
jgi:hypothetical protein